MFFELSIIINRSPIDVFSFLRDKDSFKQKSNSPVLIIEKTTSGPPYVGTRYREVVQMLPLIRGEILSEITRFEPEKYLEEDFKGAGMRGHIAYQFLSINNETKLIQKEILLLSRFLKPFEPIIKHVFFQRLRKRLDGIKVILESGWSPNQN